MMETGGRAFPVNPGSSHAEQGMTLRDYFAAQAMSDIYQRVQHGGFKRVAELAYQLADAMIEERNKS